MAKMVEEIFSKENTHLKKKNICSCYNLSDDKPLAKQNGGRNKGP